MLSQLARSRNAASQLRLLKGRSLLQPSTLLRHHSHTSRINSLQASASNQQSETRPRRSSFQTNRSLATAADSPSAAEASYYEGDSYNPAFQRRQQWSSFFPPPPEEFDPSSLTIVSESLETKPKVFKKIRGVGGDEAEMLANLDLSIRHAQFERASNLMNRLRDFHPVDSQSYRDLHNDFLQAMVSHAVNTRNDVLVLQVQRWFEVDMPYSGVEADATTFAIMITLSLRMFYGGKRDRAVRRYWVRAKQAQVAEEVLAVPVLTDRELGELSEICSSDLRQVAIDSLEASSEPLLEPSHDKSPELRSVDQKGLGLSSLQDSLALFSHPPIPIKADATDIETKEIYEQRRQEQLEVDVMQAAMERWRKEYAALQQAKPETMTSSKALRPLLAQWHHDLTERIKDELKHVEIAEANPVKTLLQKERCEYGTYLRVLSPETLATVTLITVVDTLIRGGMEKGIKLAPLLVHIGTDIYEEMLARRILADRKEAGKSSRRSKILEQILSGRKEKDGRMKWRNMVQKMEKEKPEVQWSIPTRVKLGGALMNCLYEVAKVVVPKKSTQKTANGKKEVAAMPAFQHSYQMHWGRRSGYMHIHSHVVGMIGREPASDLISRNLPMICKPRPWKDFADGAYLLHKTRIVRTTPGESLQPAYVKAVLENDGLQKIREGLNILGETAWVINHDVWNVMLDVWNSGEDIADIAPADPQLPIPPKPAPEDGPEALRTWHNEVREIENKIGSFHSQRCFQNLQLEIARAYLNETFYFPHNMDFRGRAYPIPPYLNQMGADTSRGLLLFSEAKPLGNTGLRWLKIQVANLAGFDKASFSEREQFAMDHLDDILDSANNGLHGRRWWLKAEDPWQCLASCCELRNALQLSDPTEYCSRLPIHQDGSCNGLQHYAALGGDKMGAQQVNLEPSDRPSDVYTGVSEFVKEAVARDAAEGDPIAKQLDGKVTRKIVKQTVMTNVYGVTFIGAVKQIRRQLIDHYPGLSEEIKKDGALFIARKVFQALGTIFNGANEIQYWLGDCANRITTSISPEQIDILAKDVMSATVQHSAELKKRKAHDPAKHFRSTVIWTSPLGLPIVQPYRSRVAKRVDTTFQALSIVSEDSNYTVSKRKQLQAFPPNFIHSLDATHMLLSASACHQAGLTFSAVHDSFWTHASDVDSMNEILREAFVLMHSDDVVKRLAAEFKVRYGNHMYWARLRDNSPAGKAVKAFRRRQKKISRVEELIAEYKRQKLLRSDDPELQAQGREMETAGSVFEEYGGSDDDLVFAKSLGEAAVGHVPEDVEAAEKRLAGIDLDDSDPAIASLMGNNFDMDNSVKAAPEEGLEGAEETPEAEFDMADAEPVKKKKKAGQRDWINLWLPVTFRDVPKKGEWDVARIRASQYFFS